MRTRLSETGGAADRPGSGEIPGWRVLTAVALGAAHELAGRPLQDAAGSAIYPEEDPLWLAVAVADGHGGRPHFRSARGSELAVEAGLRLARKAAARFAAGESAASLRSAAGAELVPELIGWWRQAVERDLAEHPWLSQELELLSDDDFTVAYGSTLLLAVVADPWLVLCQIGDGDIVMVGHDGLASLPVPGDPRLDGHTTTSLCQPDAADAFRVAVVDLAASDIAALLLATDGFGNAQTADPWYQPVGADVMRLAAEHGIAWVRDQLPAWAARCASSEGSGDDTAVALLLRTAIERSHNATVPAESAGARPPTQPWPSQVSPPPAAHTQTQPSKTLPIEIPRQALPSRTLPIDIPAQARPEPAQDGPAQDGPARHERAEPEPPRPEPARPEPARHEPARHERGRHERTRPAETLRWASHADGPAEEDLPDPQPRAAPPSAPGAPLP
jgi:hypothetical protein